MVSVICVVMFVFVRGCRSSGIVDYWGVCR